MSDILCPQGNHLATEHGQYGCFGFHSTGGQPRYCGCGLPEVVILRDACKKLTQRVAELEFVRSVITEFPKT
ncbi:MAG: hypothetical protein Q8N45_11090 [Anaerolineales bacterium]|nr:hypothetical protein [Anaerolineales bacterium]